MSISKYGRRFLSLNFGLRQNFSFVFVIADVFTALLGADFLDTFDLKVDIRRFRLEDHATGLCIQGRLSACSPLNLRVCRPPSGPGFSNLINHYLQLLHSSSSSSEVRHDVVHHIRTSGPSVFARPRRLGPEKLATAKAEFEHMLQLDIIRPSESSWATPLHQSVSQGGLPDSRSYLHCRRHHPRFSAHLTTSATIFHFPHLFISSIHVFLGLPRPLLPFNLPNRMRFCNPPTRII